MLLAQRGTRFVLPFSRFVVKVISHQVEKGKDEPGAGGAPALQ